MKEGQAFRRDMLPRKCDVIRHIWHLGAGKATRDAINRTSNDLIMIWESADCPPKSRKSVVKQNESLMNEYKEPNVVREGRDRRKTKEVSKEIVIEKPTRRSSRNKKDCISLRNPLAL